MGDGEQQGTIAAIARHHWRRARGVATVSVLVGDRSAAASVWAAHANGGREVVICAGPDVARIAATYVSERAVRQAIRAALLQRAERRLDLSARELDRRIASATAFERRSLADRVFRAFLLRNSR